MPSWLCPCNAQQHVHEPLLKVRSTAFVRFRSVGPNETLPCWDTRNILEFEIKSSNFKSWEYAEAAFTYSAGMLMFSTLVIAP